MNGSRFSVRAKWLCVACLLAASPARAQVDLGAVLRAPVEHSSSSSVGPPPALPALFSRGAGGGVPVIVRSSAERVSANGLASLGAFAVGELDPGRVLELASAHPDWVFDWAPPRHLLLDHIEPWVHTARFREQTHSSGQGVVVGIVDTGVELTHRDLRDAKGKTRVAWLLDVSRGAQGLHPDLETHYGCSGKLGCAIYSASDLDALLANQISGDEPNDPFGHGTHVASLAAGNGFASNPPRYVGVAPEATYVVARVAHADGTIQDADVVRAVQFVFDRAGELGMPAVVNLSLGSDFGAHDGSSGLELGLSSLVGPDYPGRAIVVAAGNSAGLYDFAHSEYPGPFGIHSEVHVPEASVSRVPLLTPPAAGSVVNGTAYVWIGFRRGDEVSVAVEDDGGTRLPAVSPGSGRQYVDGKLTIQVLNGTLDADGGNESPGRYGAIVTIDGSWSANRHFVIRLEGHGTAELWVQGEGDLNPERALGALFPRAAKEGTINVPASASALIAVGATLNRTSWVDANGEAISMPDLGVLQNAPLDTIGYFSAAGPNALGALKPDLVAPGVYVAGAMARSADPRSTMNALFASAGRCPTSAECLVVDDTHAISSGTSMSAPIVAGAIALLFERDPTLTQDAARAILQAGARPLQGIVIDPRQIGPGALDLQGALAVLTAGESPALRIPGSQSRLLCAASFAHPDPNWPLECYLELRDDAGNVADGFDLRRLGLHASPAVIREGLTRVAAGFYRFSLVAPAGSGGEPLHLAASFDDRTIVSKDLPIAVDRAVAGGGVSARGGCEFVACAAESSAASVSALWLLLASGFARRRSHAREIRRARL